MATRTSVRIMVNELPVSEKKPFIHRRSRPPKDENRMCPVGRCIPRAWLTVWKGHQASHKYLHTEKRSQCPHFHPSRALLATSVEKWDYRTLTSEMFVTRVLTEVRDTVQRSTVCLAFYQVQGLMFHPQHHKPLNSSVGE